MNTDFLDSREFYDLMQIYRHAPFVSQEVVFNAYCEVKKYIKSQILQQLSSKNFSEK